MTDYVKMPKLDSTQPEVTEKVRNLYQVVREKHDPVLVLELDRIFDVDNQKEKLGILASVLQKLE